MKFVYIALILLLSTSVAFSQNGVMQDDDGKSAFPLGDNTTKQLLVNIQDTKAQFTIQLDTIVNLEEPAWSTLGFSLKGKDKVFSLTKNGIPNFQGSGSYTYTRGIGHSRGDHLWASRIFYLKAEASVSRFKVADTNETIFKEAVDDDVSWGGNVQAGFYDWSLFNSTVMFAGAVQCELNDNIADLTKHQMATYLAKGDYLTSLDPKEVYLEDEIVKDRIGGTAILDVGKYWNRISVVSHSRWEITEGKRPQLKQGIGVYGTEDGAPLNAVFGFQFLVDDAFNVQDKDKDWWERSVINLVLGFKFSG